VTTTTTNHTDIDQAVGALVAHADEWAKLPIASRLALLTDLKRRTAEHAERWVTAAAGAKGLAPESPLVGEEWLSGPYALLSGASAMHQALERLWRGLPTFDPEWVGTRPDGTTMVRVLPIEWHDKLLLSGYEADVWMQEGVTPENLESTTASFYHQTDPEGRVCVVLGAGNIASIAPMDVLYKLFVEGQVVVLKLNPVNDYLGPIFEDVFGELVARGFVRFVYGGGEVGAYLTSHPQVDTIHITGSARTHDVIVFGPGEEGAERRARNEPVLDKPITSELGGVSPVIVVPGPWTEADLQFQAEHFVTQKLHNGGFNCIAAQVLVLPEGWEHTDRLVELIEHEIHHAPDRPHYYPGVEDRHLSAVERHDDTAHFGEGGLRSHLRNVPADEDSFAFTDEFFAAVFATTHLPNGSPGEFLDAAVQFANETLHGSLGASLIIHPDTIAELGDRFDAAIADLRYGSIGINVWTAMAFLLPRAPWGGYPGSPLNDIGSGRGVVHNALMFERPLKTVVRGPFRETHRSLGRGFHLSPKPPWFVTNKTAAATAEAFTKFAADGSLRHLPGLFGSALRG
jgi:aldehyde dehydrogenase (NAD(P)+)